MYDILVRHSSIMPIMSTNPSTPAGAVERILQLLKIGNDQPASTPGFAHALKLSFHLISRKDLTWNDADATLTYRYKFGGEHVGSRRHTHTTVGLLLAIMDEISTSACFGAGTPSGPGVSLHMQLELCQQQQQQLQQQLLLQHQQGMLNRHPMLVLSRQHLLLPQEIDIVSKVVKLGRTISFIRTDFINPNTRQLLAIGTHSKYMPPEHLFQFPSSSSSSTINMESSSQPPSEPAQPPSEPVMVHDHYYEEKDLFHSVIGPNLVRRGIGLATFQINREHVNGFGSLHVSTEEC